MYAPFVGAGIRVTKVSPDFREVEVKMKLRWYNKNYVGTQYGGGIFSMTDGFYIVMLIQILGREYTVWDKASRIQFLKPGKTELCAKHHLSNEVIEDIISKTKDGSRYFAEISIDVTDTSEQVIARVDKTIYIRKRKPQ